MSKIVKITKPVILRFEDREISLPEEIKESIKNFWTKAVKENPHLYNGPDYAVEEATETQECIEVMVVKTNYAHYLYDERIGIKEDAYRCRVPWGGILLLSKDNYFVVGEMDKTTSVPYCLQISGGGIDASDIQNGIINIDSNIKRELKEEMNLNLEEIDYKIEYIEYPDEKRNAFGLLAIGKINKTKDELEKHFEEYKQYLVENKLELEFRNLVFLKKDNALQEFDNLNNPKRPYLRDLIKEACG